MNKHSLAVYEWVVARSGTFLYLQFIAQVDRAEAIRRLRSFADDAGPQRLENVDFNLVEWSNVVNELAIGLNRGR